MVGLVLNELKDGDVVPILGVKGGKFVVDVLPLNVLLGVGNREDESVCALDGFALEGLR